MDTDLVCSCGRPAVQFSEDGRLVCPSVACNVKPKPVVQIYGRNIGFQPNETREEWDKRWKAQYEGYGEWS